MATTGDANHLKIRRNIQNPKDAISLLTGDDLARFRKKYFFPNDVVLKLPSSTDRVHQPPPGYVGIYEATLKAGFRFPPAPELLDILKATGVCISQLACRTMAIVMGLTVLFRERGARLTPEILARFGSFHSDSQGRILFKSDNFIMEGKELIRYWSVGFFFVKNDWSLSEKQGEPLPLPRSLEIATEEVLKMLKFSDLRDLHLEVRFLWRMLSDERLRKVGVFVDPGRSIATRLKKTERRQSPIIVKPLERPTRDSDCEVVSPHRSGRKTLEAIPLAIPLKSISPLAIAGVPQIQSETERVPPNQDRRRAEGDRALGRQERRSMEGGKAPLRQDRQKGEENRAPERQKRRRMEGGTATSRQERESIEDDAPLNSLSKISIPEHILDHSCTGYTQHEDWMNQRAELDKEYNIRMKNWNSEFVRIKFLMGKLKNRYDSKCQEVEDLGV